MSAFIAHHCSTHYSTHKPKDRMSQEKKMLRLSPLALKKPCMLKKYAGGGDIWRKILVTIAENVTRDGDGLQHDPITLSKPFS